MRSKPERFLALTARAWRRLGHTRMGGIPLCFSDQGETKDLQENGAYQWEIKELAESGEWPVTSGEQEAASGAVDSPQSIVDSETNVCAVPAGAGIFDSTGVESPSCNARHMNDGGAEI